jgi:CRISPR system Cascade subunit CasE
MHLTRFEINVVRRDARTMLASPQRMHAAVLAAFPESRTDGRVLWRLDEMRHDVVLYIVSPDKPDLTHLVETIGRPTYGWQTRDYGSFLDRLSTGERWAFRLRANPVHNVRLAGSGRGKRVGHVTAEQQIAWFHRQAQRHGFTLVTGSAGEPDLMLRDRRSLRFERQHRTVTLATAMFEGTLQVADPVAMRIALVGGIGSGKGYGCGLLTLAAP